MNSNQYRLHRLSVTCTFTALLAACGAAQTAPSGTDTEDATTLYGDFLVEGELVDGRNVIRDGYQRHLQACAHAGAPTTPLSAQDVAKLGTTRAQIWLDKGRQAYRVEHWNFEVPEPIGTCHFRPTRDGSNQIWTTKQYASTDLATGETTQDTATPDDLQRMAVDLEAQAQDREIARNLGYSGPAQRTVAGQPCQEWTESNGDKQCIWSGGLGSGFTAGPLGVGDCVPSLSTITLAREPGKGLGCRVTTRHFSVGQPIDAAVFDPDRGTRS